MNGPRGRIQIISGCMFSGKTAALIEQLTMAARAGQRVQAFKHSYDDRYDAVQLATHDGRRHGAIAVASSQAVLELSGGAKIVGIDEAHFFGASLVAVAEAMRARGQVVIAAGLDHDAWGRAFPPLPRLKQIADQVTELSAPCRCCGSPARYSQRMTPVTDPRMVGGTGEYEPRCAGCFSPLPAPAPDY